MQNLAKNISSTTDLPEFIYKNTLTESLREQDELQATTLKRTQYFTVLDKNLILHF